MGVRAAQRPRRLARPRTPAFHVGNTGSNPVGDANQSRVLLPDCKKAFLTATGPEFTRKLTPDQIADGISAAAQNQKAVDYILNRN
jgi:hypothetical protein